MEMRRLVTHPGAQAGHQVRRLGEESLLAGDDCQPGDEEGQGRHGLAGPHMSSMSCQSRPMSPAAMSCPSMSGRPPSALPHGHRTGRQLFAVCGAGPVLHHSMRQVQACPHDDLPRPNYLLAWNTACSRLRGNMTCSQLSCRPLRMVTACLLAAAEHPGPHTWTTAAQLLHIS